MYRTEINDILFKKHQKYFVVYSAVLRVYQQPRLLCNILLFIVPRCECTNNRDCPSSAYCRDCECIPDTDAQTCDPYEGCSDGKFFRKTKDSYSNISLIIDPSLPRRNDYGSLLFALIFLMTSRKRSLMKDINMINQ